MPIIIARTGELPLTSAPLSPEQKTLLWEAYIKNWVDKNPDKFRAMLEQPQAAKEEAGVI